MDSRNDEWTAAEIKAHPGDLILVIATGKVKTPHVMFKEVTAKGAPNGVGQLQMKIGTGTVIPVGDRWVGALLDPGALKFRIESNGPKMIGSYAVRVVVIPAGSLPPAVKVDAE